MTPVSYDGPYPSRAAAIGWLEDGRGFYPMESATILRAGGAEPAELVVVVVRGPGVREWALQVRDRRVPGGSQPLGRWCPGPGRAYLPGPPRESP